MHGLKETRPCSCHERTRRTFAIDAVSLYRQYGNSASVRKRKPDNDPTGGAVTIFINGNPADDTDFWIISHLKNAIRVNVYRTLLFRLPRHFPSALARLLRTRSPRNAMTQQHPAQWQPQTHPGPTPGSPCAQTPAQRASTALPPPDINQSAPKRSSRPRRRRPRVPTYASGFSRVPCSRNTSPPADVKQPVAPVAANTERKRR